MLQQTSRALKEISVASLWQMPVVFGLLCLSGSAIGQSLQCNKNQTRCLTESNVLTIGDEVGIFNADGELVAKGEVKAMKGSRRAVTISERHSTIRQGHELALLQADPFRGETAPRSYKIFREPGSMVVGGSIGLSTVSIGEGIPASEFSGYGQWRKWGDIQIIGRGVFSAMEGEVTHNSEVGYERLPVSIKSFGLLGGVAYTLRESKPVSFRGEAAVGGMLISGTVNDESALLDDANTNSNVKNGMAPAGRWSLGVVFNATEWHFHADFSQSLVYQALANTIAFGISKDLK